MINKHISIITDFGCETNCWYCIWKQNKLRNAVKDTDWYKLKNFLYKHKQKSKVSISGGGDPLNNFKQNKLWWNKLFNIVNKINMKIDVRTREHIKDNKFWLKINRCNLSCDKLKNNIDFLKYLLSIVNVRITHVITKKTTDDLIKQFAEFSIKYDCQLTMKKLVGHNDNNRFDEIKSKFKDLCYVDSCDYNIYYMPNNSITDKFL